MAIDSVPIIGGGVSKRELKIFWLIDVSGSMAIDGKMTAVNRAIKAVIPELQSSAEDFPDIQTYVQAMKFGNGAEWHNSSAEKIESYVWREIDAEQAVTDMGAAMQLLAHELTEEKLGKKAIPPVIILLSDGQPTDNYEGGLEELLKQRWSKKSIRVAIAIGKDADEEKLKMFCSNPVEIPPFVAGNETQLVKFIKWASVALSRTASTPAIDATGGVAAVPTPPPIKAEVKIGEASDDTDDDVW
ncbi:MAG: VWA domain-containing protein [Firmicutes bacterium]|nr:VWA domain-containing protein [Bacillota bacterium]